MADKKISALPAATVINDADQVPKNEAGTTKAFTASLYRAYATGSLSAFSASTVAAGFAADTYLAGSAITAPAAGAWKAGTKYRLIFDVTKTAAGVAAPVLTVRMGTLGTTGDAAILTFTWTVGTAVADVGIIQLWAHFRTVGGGTTAVLSGIAELRHGLPTTGLDNAGAAEMLTAVSAGFNSTTQTIIGASFNGGAAFSGTVTLVEAEVLNL